MAHYLPFVIPWPYAARAIIQWAYDGTTMSFYVTFRLPMNQTVMPDIDKWTFWNDIGSFQPTTQVWVDAYTLLLQFDHDGSGAYWLCYYDGPGPETYARKDPERKTLETTWGKQWEKWGNIWCYPEPA